MRIRKWEQKKSDNIIDNKEGKVVPHTFPVRVQQIKSRILLQKIKDYHCDSGV